MCGQARVTVMTGLTGWLAGQHSHCGTLYRPGTVEALPLLKHEVIQVPGWLDHIS